MERKDVDIVYEIAQDKDYERVLDCIRCYYYPEEPITIGNEPKEQSVEDEEFSMSALSSGTTIMAVDKAAQNGDLLGVLISGPIKSNDADEMLEDAKRTYDNKWSEILTLLAFLEHRADVCRLYNIERGLHMHVLGVNPAFRGQSIATQLTAKCMEVGKELGYKIASMDCTSVFSIKIAKKLGMECIKTLAFADYKDNTGRQIFKPPPPNYEIKTFMKRL